MTAHAFRDFVLGEEARSLRLGGREVAMHPLVLDLLAYLVRHAGRVVPRDEPMDALWPEVAVTDGRVLGVADDEERLTAAIIELATMYGRHGYHHITALLRQAGWVVNKKRVERI
jgi:DNA-binding winged helix-turn-helix (wHTH) protein